MPIGMLARIPGGTAELYDAVMTEMDWYGQEKPQGFISHYAGPTEGGWVVFDVWESKADFERFAGERLMGALERASGGEPPQLVPEFIEIYNADHAGAPAAA